MEKGIEIVDFVHGVTKGFPEEEHMGFSSRQESETSGGKDKRFGV